MYPTFIPRLRIPGFEKTHQLFTSVPKNTEAIDFRTFFVVDFSLSFEEIPQSSSLDCTANSGCPCNASAKHSRRLAREEFTSSQWSNMGRKMK